MKNKIKNLKSVVFNNKSVIENYFFMTILQILNSFFSLFLYPYLIRTLGAEQYGLYVYISSLVLYPIVFITFGFDLPGMKKITENIDDTMEKSQIVSTIFTAKIYLLIISAIIYFLMIFLIPSFRINYEMYAVAFIGTFTNIIFPNWYFQAVQKMKWVTGIQLFTKLISLPFIFLLIETKEDLLLYFIITVFVNVLGGLLAFYILIFKEKITITFINYKQVKYYYKESLPLFLTNLIGTLKEQGAVLIIGSFFGMKDVAIYDLANKIMNIVRMLFVSVNTAIFPKIYKDINANKIKKVIRYEYFAGGFMMFFVLLFGYWAVLLLGGDEMIEAYSLVVVLSPTIVTWLVVGAYIYFLFLPTSNSKLITRNQLVSMLSFFVFTFIGLLISNKIIIFCIAMTLSGLLEIVYCRYLVKRNILYFAL